MILALIVKIFWASPSAPRPVACYRGGLLSVIARLALSVIARFLFPSSRDSLFPSLRGTKCRSNPERSSPENGLLRAAIAGLAMTGKSPFPTLRAGAPEGSPHIRVTPALAKIQRGMFKKSAILCTLFRNKFEKRQSCHR